MQQVPLGLQPGQLKRHPHLLPAQELNLNVAELKTVAAVTMWVLILNVLFILLQPFQENSSILWNLLHFGFVIILYLGVNYSATSTLRTTSTSTDSLDSRNATTADGIQTAPTSCKTCAKRAVKFRDIGTATCLDRGPFVPSTTRPREFIDSGNPLRPQDRAVPFLESLSRPRECMESGDSSTSAAASPPPRTCYQVYIPYRYFLAAGQPSASSSASEHAAPTATTPVIFLNGVVQSSFSNVGMSSGAVQIIFLPSTEPRVRLVPPKSPAPQPTRETRPRRSRLYDYYIFDSEPLDKKLDLRLRYLSDAMTAFFEFYIRMGRMYVSEGYKEDDRYIYVVTGYGKYSENGIGVIKPEVQSFLDDNNVRHRWLNRGLVMIDFCEEEDEVSQYRKNSGGEAQDAEGHRVLNGEIRRTTNRVVIQTMT
ncbi:hypothetical protein Btru_062708 [Bulinus truncatus]|nr:hypothetical protein Btru_062708 [Bulinus truncatus]